MRNGPANPSLGRIHHPFLDVTNGAAQPFLDVNSGLPAQLSGVRDISQGDERLSWKIGFVDGFEPRLEKAFD